MENILGHKNKIDYLKKLAQKNILPSSLFFVGSEGVGKLKIALSLSRLISSKNNILVLSNNNLISQNDFPLITFKDSIKIDQIRKIILFLNLTSDKIKEKKVVIIDNFHLATIEAQNSILKTLEEPSQDSIIILVSNKPENILPTIKSRVQNINFGILEKNLILKYLKNNFSKLSFPEIKEIANYSYGRISRAAKIAKNYQNWQKNKKIFLKVFDPSAANRLKAIEEVSKNNDILEEFFEEIFLLLRQNLKISPDIKTVIFLKKFLNFYYLVKKNNLNVSWQLEYFFLFFPKEVKLRNT